MMVLYVDPECEGCRDVREALEDLAAAHRVVDARREGGPGPHVMLDCGQEVRGHAEMLRRVQEQGKLLRKWHLISADACYCFEDE